MERIQKILAHGGIASRRAAEQLIKAGRVRVNGHVVTELGAKADARRDRIEVDGKRVVAEEPVYVVLHKPRGVVSTMSDPEGRPTVKELLSSLGARVYPVGRLDFATSGVLLATNDGELADGLLHPRKTVPKTYVLKVKGTMTPDDVDVWRKGVRLDDGMTLPAEAKLLRHEGDKTWLELTIREGRNQQIRRMGEATRFPVMRLARVAFAEITAEGLAPGRWRHLTRDELIALKKVYGVPRSIPSAASIQRTGAAPSKATQRTVPSVRRGSTGRTQRAFGSEQRRRSGENWGEAPETAETSSGRLDASGGRGARRGPSRAEGSAQESSGPRYGGGSPGRRGYDVAEDWGGGAGRGSSRGHGDERGQGSLHGGRFGRTRTTGTSGGIGSRESAPRVKGRRGR
jgi:23S rRNA pseudouridine2605 synthase